MAVTPASVLSDTCRAPDVIQTLDFWVWFFFFNFFFLMVWPLFSQHHICCSAKPGYLSSCTPLIRSTVESCWPKQILKGMEEEQGSSRFRVAPKSLGGLALQVGTALTFEVTFGFLPSSHPNSVYYRWGALFQDNLYYISVLLLQSNTKILTSKEEQPRWKLEQVFSKSLKVWSSSRIGVRCELAPASGTFMWKSHTEVKSLLHKKKKI